MLREIETESRAVIPAQWRHVAIDAIGPLYTQKPGEATMGGGATYPQAGHHQAPANGVCRQPRKPNSARVGEAGRGAVMGMCPKPSKVQEAGM